MAKDQDFEKDFVRLKNVSKIYRMGEVEIRAVDKIEFAIDKGEFVVVVGPSGAGKTTVLNILGGMDTVTSGDVLVDGENIAKYSQRKLTARRTYHDLYRFRIVLIMACPHRIFKIAVIVLFITQHTHSPLR